MVRIRGRKAWDLLVGRSNWNLDPHENGQEQAWESMPAQNVEHVAFELQLVAREVAKIASAACRWVAAWTLEGKPDYRSSSAAQFEHRCLKIVSRNITE
jgi:hypothetical protein